MARSEQADIASNSSMILLAGIARLFGRSHARSASFLKPSRVAAFSSDLALFAVKSAGGKMQSHCWSQSTTRASPLDHVSIQSLTGSYCQFNRYDPRASGSTKPLDFNLVRVTRIEFALMPNKSPTSISFLTGQRFEGLVLNRFNKRLFALTPAASTVVCLTWGRVDLFDMC